MAMSLLVGEVFMSAMALIFAMVVVLVQGRLKIRTHPIRHGDGREISLRLA